MDVRHTHELSNDNHFHDFIHNFLLPFVVFLYTNHCVTFSQLSSASLLWFLWEVRSVVRPPHIPGALSATSAVMRAMISRGPQTCSVHGQGSGALTHLPAQVCYNLCYSLSVRHNHTEYSVRQPNWIFAGHRDKVCLM